jgi:hypothetical protein
MTRFIIAAFSLFLAGAALADPPTRVGRISLVEGAASIRHGEDPNWSPGALNYPVIAGDTVWVDRGARAEVEIGGAEIRLDAATQMTIQRMDDEITLLRIDQGVANLKVRFMAGPLSLASAAGQMEIRGPGEYHVDAGRPDGPPTQIVMAVLNGEARFSGVRGVSELHSGQGAMVPPDQSALTVVQVMPTPFDQWAEDRAMTLQVSQSAQYVSPEVTGYQDLDEYGRWEPVPDYGMVWFPSRVEVGWAPYRYGHWAYVAPWGWTWIDEAPWGFAPFHYGRWANFEGRWAWIPGERRERPCYSPALVAFIGGGPGVGIGVSWVPLGPHEVFHPYYRVSDDYVRRINRPHVANVAQINVTNVTVNNYANHGAMSGTNSNAFTGGQPVRHNMASQQEMAAQAKAPVLGNLNHLPPPSAPAAAIQPAGRPAVAPPPQMQRPQVPQQQPMQMPHPSAPAPMVQQPQFHPQPQVQPQQQQQHQQQQQKPAQEHDKEKKDDHR